MLDIIGGDGIVTAEMLADRMRAPETRKTVAERASEDRSWTYGHVIVDEAQELSPMAWRMLLRRCPSRSFTIVGDIAQTSAPAGTRWWPETMDPLFQAGWHLRELTVSYRIPAAVASAAQSFARAAGLPVSEMSAARDVDDALATIGVSEREAIARVACDAAAVEADSLATRGGGLVAVIAPEDLISHVSSLARPGIEVMTAREAKGLEFDSVVIADPRARSPGCLKTFTWRSHDRRGGSCWCTMGNCQTDSRRLDPARNRLPGEPRRGGLVRLLPRTAPRPRPQDP